MSNTLAPTRAELADLFWRVFWTFLSAALGGLVGMQALDLNVLEVAGLAGLSAAVNVVLVFSRQKLGIVDAPARRT